MVNTITRLGSVARISFATESCQSTTIWVVGSPVARVPTWGSFWTSYPTIPGVDFSWIARYFQKSLKNCLRSASV